MCVDAVPRETSRQYLVGQLPRGERRDRLLERITDRSTLAERAVESDREHASCRVADRAIHADDAVDPGAQRLGVCSAEALSTTRRVRRAAAPMSIARARADTACGACSP